jgi:C-terminal processing protease CtpA/Prc
LETYRIEAVLRPSPASEAGLKRGDHILRVDGQAVAGTHPIELMQRPIGARLELEMSDGRQLTLETELLVDLLDSIRDEKPDVVAEMGRTRAGGALF